MYLDGPIVAFLDKLASSSPEPGGGAASALVGSVGAALVSMVANLTLGKSGYEGVQDEVRKLLDSSEKERKSLENLIQKDTEVYGILSAAYKMPRESEEDKKKRKSAIQQALREATMVPFSIAERCLEVARLSKVAAEIGNVGAVSDAGVAALLAFAGAEGAALNIRINVVSIEDREFAEGKWTETQDILSSVSELKDEVVKLTYEKLG